MSQPTPCNSSLRAELIRISSEAPQDFVPQPVHHLAMTPNRLLALIIVTTVTSSAQDDRALSHVQPNDARLAVAWNQQAYDIAFAEDQFLTFKGQRAHAMMHIAMHDALNAIVPVYRQYTDVPRDRLAHPIAAAAQAAHDVLVSQYPSQVAPLDAQLVDWLSRVPDGRHKRRGIALGRQSAAAILALRAGDGWDFQGMY